MLMQFEKQQIYDNVTTLLNLNFKLPNFLKLLVIQKNLDFIATE